MKITLSIPARPDEYREAPFGEEFSTTFWEDFAIANQFGKDAVLDTYRRAVKEWKRDYKYMTAIAVALNYHCWLAYHEKNEELTAVYRDLFYKAQDKIYTDFDGNKTALKWAFRTLD